MAILGSTGTLIIRDPGSTNDYLGSGALSGTQINGGYSYSFSKSFTGIYAGVTISGTVAMGEVDPLSSNKTDYFVIDNSIYMGQLLSISNLTIYNGSANTLNYQTGANKNLLTFTNSYSSYTMDNYITGLNGQAGTINSSGVFVYNSISSFNLQMLSQALNGTTVQHQQYKLSTKNNLDSTCNFISNVDTTKSNFFTPSQVTSHKLLLNELILPAGCTLKL